MPDCFPQAKNAIRESVKLGLDRTFCWYNEHSKSMFQFGRKRKEEPDFLLNNLYIHTCWFYSICLCWTTVWLSVFEFTLEGYCLWCESSLICDTHFIISISQTVSFQRLLGCWQYAMRVWRVREMGRSMGLPAPGLGEKWPWKARAPGLLGFLHCVSFASILSSQPPSRCLHRSSGRTGFQPLSTVAGTKENSVLLKWISL